MIGGAWEGQPPRQKGKPKQKAKAAQAWQPLRKSSRPPLRPVVWTTVREGFLEDDLDTWEARPRGQDTAPSSRAVYLTTARQSAREGALAN